MGKLNPRFLLPNNSETMIDYHVHSNYNDDATGTVEDYVQSALSKGLSSIAITNHVWRTSTWIEDFVNEVRTVRFRHKYHLLIGFEAKIVNINGEIDIASRFIKEGELVLGALHHLPTRDDYVWLNDNHVSPSKAAEIIREATLNMLSRREASAVAHPLALYHLKYNSPFPDDFLEEIVCASSKYGIALEIYNSKHPLFQKTFKKFIRLCVEYKAPMSVGSDAHSPAEVGNLNYKEISTAIQEALETM